MVVYFILKLLVCYNAINNLIISVQYHITSTNQATCLKSIGGQRIYNNGYSF